MYYFTMFDAVMFSVSLVLLIAMAVSLTHGVMKAKMEANLNHYIITNSAVSDNNVQLLKDWSIASTYMYAVHELAVIYHCFDPNKPAMDQVCELLNLESKLALDPSTSAGAKQLINKAKREHGKKIRKAADRKLERTEREYEQRIESLKLTIQTVRNQRGTYQANIAAARYELSAFQSIVDQELHNFIRLPSVRNACKKAINANHKAWQEL